MEAIQERRTRQFESTNWAAERSGDISTASSCGGHKKCLIARGGVDESMVAARTGRGGMADSEIRAKQERVIDVFAKRPQAGLSTTPARAVVGDGLRCEYVEGDNSVVADMPEIMGGEASGPSPGFYARAGLCTCVAIGIKMAAVRGGLDVREVAVDVEVDFDDGAMFGLGDRTAAPLDTRISISIDTDAPLAEVQAMVDTTLEADPWFLALRDAQSVTTELQVGG